MSQKLIQNGIKLQEKLAKQVITKNFLPKTIRKVCGVDVSYKDDNAYCSAVIFDIKQKMVIDSVDSSLKAQSPYIPGLFMLRESKPIFHVLKKLGEDFDVLLVDGHGQLHPRYCGLACYVGIKLNKPTIGVAKKLLCGTVKPGSKVDYGGKILGYQIKKNNKRIFVSVGHKINLKTAKSLVNELILGNNWYPEPLRLADVNSKKLRRKRQMH